MPKLQAADPIVVENGAGVIVQNGGSLNLGPRGLMQQGGVNLVASASFTPAAGAANVCEVTIAIKDAFGATIAEVFNLDIWLSDSPAGAGLTAVTASGAVAAKASSGTDLVTLVAKKALRVQTTAAGIYILSITDTAKTGFYVSAQLPWTGRTNVGAQLVTGNYG